jgi:dienelactone hydrolase
MNRKEWLHLIRIIISIPVLLAACGSPTSTPTLPPPTATPVVGLPPVVYSIPGMEGITVRKDLVYDSTTPLKKMDVYYPTDFQSGSQRPAVILVHWRASPDENLKDTAPFTSWGQLVAASGMIAVTFRWDNSEDVEHLIQSVRTNAGELGISQDRLCLFAFCAGVPPAMRAAIRDTPDYVRCGVAYYGDMSVPLAEIKYEPADQVAPLLIVMAANDVSVPADKNNPFIDYATSHGAQVELLIHPSGVHKFDIYNDDEQSRDIIKKTLEFLQTHLGTE